MLFILCICAVLAKRLFYAVTTSKLGYISIRFYLFQMTARGSTTNNNNTKTFISASPNSSLNYHSSGLPMDVMNISTCVCVCVCACTYLCTCVCVPVCVCVCWRKVGGWRRKMERSKRVDRADRAAHRLLDGWVTMVPLFDVV